MATRRGPDNTCKVVIGGTIQGINWANVFWFKLTTSATPTQADLDAWLTAVVNEWQTQINTLQASTVTFTHAEATLFLPASGLLTSAKTLTGTGAAAGTPLPDTSAAKVISHSAAVYWRGGKPRTYLAGPVTADVQFDHLLTPTAAADLGTRMETIRSFWNGIVQGAITATQYGFVSFRSGLADRPAPLFFPITGSKGHRRLGSQRRRLGKWVP